MATVHVSVCAISGVSNGGASAVVYDNAPIIAGALTTSGTAASTTTLAAATSLPNKNGRMVTRCVSVDAAHYIRVGGTASATAGYYVAAGTFVDLAFPAGSEVSAITA